MPAISPQRMQDRYDAILDAAKGAFADKRGDVDCGHWRSESGR